MGVPVDIRIENQNGKKEGETGVGGILRDAGEREALAG